MQLPQLTPNIHQQTQRRQPRLLIHQRLPRHRIPNHHPRRRHLKPRPLKHLPRSPSLIMQLHINHPPDLTHILRRNSRQPLPHRQLRNHRTRKTQLTRNIHKPEMPSPQLSSPHTHTHISQNTIRNPHHTINTPTSHNTTPKPDKTPKHPKKTPQP